MTTWYFTMTMRTPQQTRTNAPGIHQADAFNLETRTVLIFKFAGNLRRFYRQISLNVDTPAQGLRLLLAQISNSKSLSQYKAADAGSG
jgi:hypothetical protein